MEKIPWYFLWSENYRFFYEVFKGSVNEPNMEIRPLEIPQSRFDSELYANPDIKKQHFFTGSCLKVDAVLECLETMAEEYMVFSDIDILVKPGVYDVLDRFRKEEYDMVYMQEGEHTNIGFLLLRKSPATIAFWKQVKECMLEKNEHDQAVVNRLLPTFSGKWGHFEKKHVLCNNEWHGQDGWVVLQLLCSNLSKEFNMAEKIFYIAQHIDNLNDYMQFVKPEIIPYIYKFQEILMNQRKDKGVWMEEKA